MKRPLFPLVMMLIALPASAGSSFESQAPSSGASQAAPGDWYRPPLHVTWHWQLKGRVNTAHSVDIYDIDLFDTPRSVIRSLKANGRRVICYFSAGSYEGWRPDAANFAVKVLGKPMENWPDEHWLDIRAPEVRRIMTARLDLAAQKGCDGVEPDNMDGYDNATGFRLTATDQLDYSRFIAKEAHARGLAVGLKNNLHQAGELVADFDFSINEQCHEFDECRLLAPFVEAGKPVLNAEYKQDYVLDEDQRDSLCQSASKAGLSTLVLPRDLDDSFRYSCL